MITNQNSWSLGPLQKSELPCPNKSLALCGPFIPTHPSDPFLGPPTSPSASHIPYRAIQIAASHRRPSHSICSFPIAHETRETTAQTPPVAFSNRTPMDGRRAPRSRQGKIHNQKSTIGNELNPHLDSRQRTTYVGNKLEAGLGSPSTIHNPQSTIHNPRSAIHNPDVSP